jgi:hypothetical protein
MQMHTMFTKNHADKSIPVAILEVEGRKPHRPRNRYRLVIRDDNDARIAKRAKLPIFPIHDSMVTMLGYPMRFPTLIVVPTTARSAIQSDLPVVEFVSGRAVSNPRIEDIMIAMLRFDPLAARALICRNLDSVDKAYLAKRIYQEDLETDATRVRLYELLPFSPVGEALPAHAIARVDRANLPRGVIP